MGDQDEGHSLPNFWPFFYREYGWEESPYITLKFCLIFAGARYSIRSWTLLKRKDQIWTDRTEEVRLMGMETAGIEKHGG